MHICKFITPSIIYYDITNTDVNSYDLVINSQIKLVHSGKELIRTVVNIINKETTVEVHLNIPIELDSSNPSNSSNSSNILEDTVLLYGIIVHDFKLINNERLMPLVFNAIKALYSKIRDQEKTIDDILRRLTIIEQIKNN
jgi:hypothetical protein